MPTNSLNLPCQSSTEDYNCENCIVGWSKFKSDLGKIGSMCFRDLIMLFPWDFMVLSLFSFSHPVVRYSSQPHGPQHARPPCPSPSPEVCQGSCPLNQWCHPAISSSEALFFICLQSFPASEIFPMSWLSTSDDQNSSASAEVHPKSIQGLSSLRLTGLGPLGDFSSTTIRNYQFFSVLPTLWSSSHNCTWPLERP